MSLTHLLKRPLRCLGGANSRRRSFSYISDEGRICDIIEMILFI